MNFRVWMENTGSSGGEGFDYEAYYAKMEPKLLANPLIRQELDSDHSVKMPTIQKAMGLEEGWANFLARMLAISNLILDKLGSQDSGHPSYYTTSRIPKQYLELVGSP